MRIRKKEKVTNNSKDNKKVIPPSKNQNTLTFKEWSGRITIIISFISGVFTAGMFFEKHTFNKDEKIEKLNNNIKELKADNTNKTLQIVDLKSLNKQLKHNNITQKQMIDSLNEKLLNNQNNLQHLTIKYHRLKQKKEDALKILPQTVDTFEVAIYLKGFEFQTHTFKIYLNDKYVDGNAGHKYTLKEKKGKYRLKIQYFDGLDTMEYDDTINLNASANPLAIHKDDFKQKNR